MVRSDQDELFSAATVELIEAFTKLRRTVAAAFNQEPNAPRSPENERERYAAALVAVAQFVATFDRGLAGKFFELGSAIADLNDGIARPLMVPARPDNRPADPSQQWRARARVALGLDAFMKSGIRQSEAASKIARDHPSLRRFAGKKAARALSATIIGWRREFRANRIKNFEAVELFSQGADLIGKLNAGGDFDALRRFAKGQLIEADAFDRV